MPPTLPPEILALIIAHHLQPPSSPHTPPTLPLLLTSSHLHALTLPLLYAHPRPRTPHALHSLLLAASPASLRLVRALTLDGLDLGGYGKEERAQAGRVWERVRELARDANVPPSAVVNDDIPVYSKILPSLESLRIVNTTLGPDHLKSLLDLTQPHHLTYHSPLPLPPLLWDDLSRPLPPHYTTLTPHLSSGGFPASLRFLHTLSLASPLTDTPFEMFRGRRGPYESGEGVLTRLDLQHLELVVLEDEDPNDEEHPARYHRVLEEEMNILITLVPSVRIDVGRVQGAAGRGVVRKWGEGKDGVVVVDE